MTRLLAKTHIPNRTWRLEKARGARHAFNERLIDAAAAFQDDRLN